EHLSGPHEGEVRDRRGYERAPQPHPLSYELETFLHRADRRFDVLGARMGGRPHEEYGEHGDEERERIDEEGSSRAQPGDEGTAEGRPGQAKGDRADELVERVGR